MTKPKLAVVRGHYFSQDELSFYEPLKNKFDITFFSSVKGSIGLDGNPRILRVRCLDEYLNPATAGLYRKISGAWQNITGIAPEYLFGLKKALHGFDIVQTIDYDFFMTYQVAKLKRELGFKLAAIHWENIPFARDKKLLSRFLKYRVLESVDAFFAMSERAKASLVLEGVNESKVFVIGWGVDTNKFKPDCEAGRVWRRRYGIDGEEVVILFVGRVRASKGVFELIYAAKKLVTDPDLKDKIIRVVIAGKGPSSKEAAEMVHRLGIDKNVLQLGYIPHGEIHNVHNMADIFCLPSVPRKYWQEQLGMVFLEAMACGKPVVSTLSGSIPEVVGDAGVLVQPNDHLVLYEALKRLTNDPILRASLGEQGRSRVADRFSTNRISEIMRANFKTMISENDN